MAVLAGLILPAIPAFLAVWGNYTALSELPDSNVALNEVLFFVTAALMTAPLLGLVAPLATGGIVTAMAVLIHGLRWIGWAGPVSLVLASCLIGIPFAHLFFNGDLTTEAPKMIPLLCVALATQALCGWVVLGDLRKPADKPIRDPAEFH